VVSRSLEHAAGWQNSTVLRGDLAAEVHKRKQAHDIMVTGSVSVVRTLMAHNNRCAENAVSAETAS
jgi:dihydrofolate reductase